MLLYYTICVTHQIALSLTNPQLYKPGTAKVRHCRSYFNKSFFKISLGFVVELEFNSVGQRETILRVLNKSFVLVPVKTPQLGGHSSQECVSLLHT